MNQLARNVDRTGQRGRHGELFLLLANDAACTILGASDAYLRERVGRHEGIVGRGLFEVFPDNAEATSATGSTGLRASLERVRASRIADTMAVQKADIRRSEGEGGGLEERYWSASNSPVLSGGGEILWIVHSIKDVTELVLAEHPLRRDGPHARILVADENADIREDLRRLLSMHYEVEAVADGTAALVAARERRPDLVVADIMLPFPDGLAPARALRGDPSLRDVPLILLSARGGQEGRIDGLHDGADDYLEKPFAAEELFERVSVRLEIARLHREAEARVHEREEHLRAVVETTPECVKLVAQDGTLLQMNPAGLVMIGASCAEMVVGKSIYDLIAPEHRDAFRMFNERICAGSKGTLEFDIVGVLGVRRHMETHAAPLRMPDGTMVQLALTRDVTERRNAENALRESDRRKDEFIAMLSHELRNPLAALRNAICLLLQAKTRTDDNTAHVGEVMDRQVNHLVRLVDDLLEVSRIDRGMLELRRERVELRSVVQSAVETSSALIREAGHHLDIELPRQPLWLEGDPVRLAQIFSNLLHNAARFTERRGRIAIVAEEHDGRAWISVRDTGAGFAPEVANRLFEMFAKSDRSSGLGIGLALSRRLVEMHGGIIEGRSEGEGRGAEFVVQLPLAASEATAPARASSSEAQAPIRCRVLVADDNRDAAEMLAEWLEAEGGEVSLAYDGAEAVEKARAFRPDVALLDIGMPKLDGYQAAQRIRSESGARSPKLIALTGWGQEEDRRHAREAGFDEHLVKPADLSVLRALLVSPTPSDGRVRR